MPDSDYPAYPVVAVGAVLRQDDRVLLVQRGKEPRKGAWTLPGGQVQFGERLREALIRELFEECGIIVEPGSIIDVVEYLEPDVQGGTLHHFIIVDFIATYVRGKLRPGSDVMDARWFALSELKTLDMPEITRAFFRKHFSVE